MVDRDLEIRPTKRDVNIITNKPGNRPFKYITTYCTDYKPTEGAKAPASYFVVEQYRPPVMPMAMETVQMADYKGTIKIVKIGTLIIEPPHEKICLWGFVIR